MKDFTAEVEDTIKSYGERWERFIKTNGTDKLSEDEIKRMYLQECRDYIQMLLKNVRGW